MNDIWSVPYQPIYSAYWSCFRDYFSVTNYLSNYPQTESTEHYVISYYSAPVTQEHNVYCQICGIIASGIRCNKFTFEVAIEVFELLFIELKYTFFYYAGRQWLWYGKLKLCR